MLLYPSARETRYAPIAQLDRVTDYESVGRGFESLSAYQKYQIPFQVSGIFIYARKDSKNEMQGSGGALLAAGLDGGNTLLCATGAKATSPFRRTTKGRHKRSAGKKCPVDIF